MNPIADSATAKRRRVICRACPKYIKRGSPLPVATCSQCGCVIALKVRKSNTTCPLNKW